jgi:hypothetical protein
MGVFCAETGYTPEQFWDMTLEEYGAIVTALNRRNKNG